MSTQQATESEISFGQAIGVFQKTFPDARVTGRSEQGVLGGAPAVTVETEFGNYTFETEEEASTFLLNARKFYVARTQIQDEVCAVLATSKAEAYGFADNPKDDTIKWVVSIPLTPHQTGEVFTESELAAPHNSVDRYAIQSAHTAELLASTDELLASANPALALPSGAEDITGVFQTIDALTARAAQGNQDAKVELAEKTKGLRLKMSLVKFMQGQADWSNR